MHTMPETEVFVTVGVDTHKDIHVAVALDQLGRILDKVEIRTTSAGYAELLAWASEFGTIDKVGIEGTGSHGAGLCRWLRARGVLVVEVVGIPPAGRHGAMRPGPTVAVPPRWWGR